MYSKEWWECEEKIQRYMNLAGKLFMVAFICQVIAGVGAIAALIISVV